MPCSKDYYRKCEMCGYETNTSGHWSRHQKTKKHITKAEQITINNITNNDNSTNTTNNNVNININVFTPNPDAYNLTDIIMPHLEELVRSKLIPAKAIQDIILKMGDKKPMLVRNEKLWVKEDKWKEGIDAEKELKSFCSKTEHKLEKELTNMGDDMDKYAEAAPLVYDGINKESITRKVKTKLNTPNFTDKK